MGLRADDLRGSQLRVWRTRGPRFGDIGPTKTPKSKRTITISPAAVAAFRRLAAGGRPPYLRGEHWLGIERRLEAAAHKAGVRWLGAHAMRHTHASQLIASGVPIPVVSKRLGHANASITLRVYAAAVDDAQVAALGDS